MKFPHGVAIDALQRLPFLFWLMNRCGLASIARLWWMRLAIAHQIVLIVYAIWQTSLGLPRIAPDQVGVFLMAVSLILMAALMLRLMTAAYCRFATARGHHPHTT